MDTPEVRRDMAQILAIEEATNVSSLFALPMLIRSIEEATREAKRVHSGHSVQSFPSWCF